MKKSTKISGSLKSALYWFVEDLSKGLLERDEWDFSLDIFDNSKEMREHYQKSLWNPFVIKQVFSIWSNNIEIDENGKVLNEDLASFRAFQFLRVQFDPSYSYDNINPPIESWETIEFEFDDSDRS